MRGLIVSALLFLSLHVSALSTTASTAWSWRAENSSGVTAAPASGYFSGTYSYVPGKFGNAVQFGFSTDAAIAAFPALLKPFNVGAITVSVWMKPQNAGVFVFAFGSNGNSYCIPLSLYINSDSTLSAAVQLDGVGALAATTPSPITLGNWVHVAVTYSNNSFLRVYVNGVESVNAFGSITLNPPTDVTRMAIGSNAFTANGSTSHCGGLAANYYQGLLDEFQIYAQALSASDVRRVMLNYSPGEH